MKHHPDRTQRSTQKGPWGTSRKSERRFGYPSPRRDRIADLEARVEAVEAAMAQHHEQHEYALSQVPFRDEDGRLLA